MFSFSSKTDFLISIFIYIHFIGLDFLSLLSNIKMQKLTIHENEYDKMKNSQQKRPNWLKNEAPSFTFFTFSVKEKKAKNIDIAEKKLAEVDLDFDILDQKYEEVHDSILCICDLDGKTLWMNHFLRNLAFKDHKDIYMQDFYLPKKHFQPDVTSGVINYPKNFQLNQAVCTKRGDFTMKLLYVSSNF